MTRRIVALAVSVAAFAAPAASAPATVTAGRPAGTLELNVEFGTRYQLGRQFCPAGSPASTTECVRFDGSVDIRGLGTTTISYVKAFDDTICPNRVTQQRTATLDVEGKGQIFVSFDSACADPAPSEATLTGRVVGGTGRFAGAKGEIRVHTSVFAPQPSVGGGLTGSSTDTWTGTLDVPGFEFDLTPPVITGAGNRVVRAPKKAKFVRVRYAPKALDDVDGSVRVVCKPGSGSRIKVGRVTKVTCTATDTSANTTTATFTVTVKRRGR